MLGSSASVSDVNTVINTAVAEVLKTFADTLEAAEDFESELHNLIRSTIKKHRRIIFNGNGYDDAWIKEAEGRGLSNLRTTPEALSHFLDEKNVYLFSENKIFSETELSSRNEIMLETYCKLLNIEALTMVEMAKKQILPSIYAYVKSLSDTINSTRSAVPTADVSAQINTVTELSGYAASAYEYVNDLESKARIAKTVQGGQNRADYYLTNVIPVMSSLRSVCDKAEPLVSESYWPFPTYGDILFSVR